MNKVVVVVDLQYGSTGKGQVAGTIGRKWCPDTVVCANGPNAGHTYRWTAGGAGNDEVFHRYVMHTVMPVTSVLPSVRNILLGPGAVIDIARLQKEILDNQDLFAGKRLIIHPNAAIVTQNHREAEQALVWVGSTMKGTAEAVIAKMRRLDYSIARGWSLALRECAEATELRVLVDELEYTNALDFSRKLLVEGAQGASLSIHSRFYPHTTSRDVSTAQIWADCRLPAAIPGVNVSVIGVARTYPIRVANRFNDQGIQIGYSGDCYTDQKEISWAEIGREPELTTVTRLPRRLFTFSTAQILDSVRYNAPTQIALTFCDYLPSHNEQHPDIPDGMKSFPVGVGAEVSPCVQSYTHRLEAAAGCRVNFLSFGPNDTDLYSPEPLGATLGELRLPWEV